MLPHTKKRDSFGAADPTCASSAVDRATTHTQSQWAIIGIQSQTTSIPGWYGCATPSAPIPAAGEHERVTLPEAPALTCPGLCQQRSCDHAAQSNDFLTTLAQWCAHPTYAQ